MIDCKTPRQRGSHEILWDGHLSVCKQCHESPILPCPAGSQLLRAAALEVGETLEPEIMKILQKGGR